jgi:hypothetical protein
VAAYSVDPLHLSLTAVGGDSYAATRVGFILRAGPATFQIVW